MRRKNQSSEFIKTCLAVAFIRLLREKRYDDITISEICQKSGYGRTTYYRYFDNRKSDLILYIAGVKWKEYQTKHPLEMKQNGSRALLNHIYANRDFFLLLKNQNMMGLMFDIFNQELGFKENESEVLRYGKDFIAGGFFAVIYDWTLHGCLDTPEEIETKFAQGISYVQELEKRNQQ